MGLGHSPRIVTDGLVLCLDAASKRSYPGTGTTWTDLKGGNNGTLTNGPTFNTGNGGSIVFDGSDDYISVPSFTSDLPSHSFSLEFVFKWDSYGTDNVDFITAGADEELEIHTGGGAGTNGLRFIPYDHPGSETQGTLDNPNIITNDINHIVFTAEHSSPSKSYKSGEPFLTSSTTSTITLTSSTFYIGRRGNGAFPFGGNIHTLKVYNRALTADEIRQNYLATKERYA